MKMGQLKLQRKLKNERYKKLRYLKKLLTLKQFVKEKESEKALNDISLKIEMIKKQIYQLNKKIYK